MRRSFEFQIIVCSTLMIVFLCPLVCAENKGDVALPPSPASNLVLTIKVKDQFSYESKGKKDPFTPGEFVWNNERTTVHLRECKLDGIVWDDVNPVIILEGTVLKKGATFLGATVESIGRDSAVFVIGQEKVTVPVAVQKSGDEK